MLNILVICIYEYLITTTYIVIYKHDCDGVRSLFSMAFNKSRFRDLDRNAISAPSGTTPWVLLGCRLAAARQRRGAAVRIARVYRTQVHSSGWVQLLLRALAFNYHAVHMPPMALIVIQCVMEHAAVVPHRQATRLPLETRYKLILG